MNPLLLHVNHFCCVKKFSEKRKCFYISADLFSVWLNGRQLDSHMSPCIQSVQDVQVEAPEENLPHTDVQLEMGGAF